MKQRVHDLEMQLKTARGVPRSPLEQGLTDEALPGSLPLVSDRNSFHDPLEGLDYEAATLPGHDGKMPLRPMAECSCQNPLVPT